MSRLAAALALIAVCGSAAAEAPPAGSEGAGEAAISNGDRVRARERALDDAFRQVIDQALARQLDAAALAERSSAIKLTIHPKARTYILRYAVLEEGDQGNVFRVRINAEVALYALMQDAKAGGATKSAPTAAAKVLVCLVERAGAGWVASPLSRRLVDGAAARGIDAALADGDCAPVGVEPAPADDKAAALARAKKARGVVVGAVAATATGPIHGTSLQSAHADLRLHLLDGEGHVTGEVRAERDGWGEGDAAAALAATEPALLEAMTRLAPLADRSFASPASAGVTVLLSGADRYADLQTLLRALGTIAGVSAVEPRRFSSEGVEIRVTTAATAAALIVALGRVPDGARYIAAARDARTLQIRPAPPPPPSPTDLPPPPAGALPGAPR